MEIAHIVPWAKVKEHKFRNLIALCPNCHTRFDSPHDPLDRKAMRQYKINLNPLLSVSFEEVEGQVSRFSAYQILRGRVGVWVKAIQEFATKATMANRPTDVEIDELRRRERGLFADALIATLDFQHEWGDDESAKLAGDILYYIADWSDAMSGEFDSIPRGVASRDIGEELAEASAQLHFSVCEYIGLLEGE